MSKVDEVEKLFKACFKIKTNQFL